MLELWTVGLSPTETKLINNFVKKRFPISSLALPTLAALIPEDIPVKIKGSLVDKLEPEPDTKFVGMSIRTPYAWEAYQLSDNLRKRGIMTFAGGVHPSALPHEALEYFDAVVVGEGELVINELLADFKNEKSKGIYKASRLTDPSEWLIPKRKLLNRNMSYGIDTLQTSRDCPYSCDFCYLSQSDNRKYRQRDVKSVIAELETISKYFILVDDNPFPVKYRESKKQLLEKMKGSPKRYLAQADIDIGNESKFLKLLYDSGCRIVAIGVDSFSPESLRAMGKNRKDIEEYKTNIKRIKDAGLKVSISLVFGSDADTEKTFDETLDALYETKPFWVVPHLMTPYPGTKLMNTLKDRLLYSADDYPEAWKHHSTYEVVFIPNNFNQDPQKLKEKYYEFCNEFFSLKSLSKATDESNWWLFASSLLWRNY